MIDHLSKTKLSALFLLGGLVEAILLPTIHEIMSKSGFSAEAADISVFIVLLIFTGSLLIYASIGARSIEKVLNMQTQFWTGQLFILILLFSASIITVLPGNEGRYWFGYGQKIIIISLFLIPILLTLFFTISPKLDLLLSILTYSLTLIFYLPSILQPPWGVIDWGHSLYVVNELLAPQSGSYPLINFAAQYTSILGYVFDLLFRARGTIDQAIWFITMLALSSIVISLAPIIRTFPKGKRYLAVVCTIPAIFIVKLNEDSYSGSLSALFSALPIRLIFPSIIALLLTTNLFRQRKTTSCIILGLVSSIAILNNFESGLVATIAALCVIVLCNRQQKWIYQVVIFCASIAAFLVLARLIFKLAYGRIKLQALIDFVGGFSGGFGSVPMPGFGLWVFAFVFLSLGVIISALYIHIAREEGNQTDENSERAAVIALFWGLFGIGMSPYYINRSVVSGQLQYILFSVFLSSAGLFLLIAKSYGRAALRNMVLIIAVLPGSISTASLIQHPSFHLAKERLKRTESPVSENYKLPIIDMRETIAQIQGKYRDEKIGLLTDFGSILAGPLSVPSYLPVNNQFDLNIVKRSIETQICPSLQQDKNAFLITSGLESRTLQIIENCGYVLYLVKANHQVYIKR